jgi:hypothetical protein
MPSVTVNVDIDLDEIDTDDLVTELCFRMRRISGRKSLSDSERKLVKESYSELTQALSFTPLSTIEIKSLDDKMKYEHLSGVFAKYSLPQIENLLP